tara:strand:- start:34333 stop:34977 length:645 start_codon:yes stop_codon:yes gene_type:complete
MTQLLDIETAFLAMPSVKDSLQLTEVKRVQRSIDNAHKSKFNHTMKLSNLINDAVKWFTSDEGIAQFAEEGIEWSKEEFGKKVFGYQKSFFYKLIKVANLDSRILEAFNTQCDAIGTDANRSIAGLLEFSRTIDLTAIEVSEDATEEEIAEAEAEVIAEASVEQERVNYQFVMSYKNPNGTNLSIRIDDQGNVSGNNLEEIANAIQFLQNSINN